MMYTGLRSVDDDINWAIEQGNQIQAPVVGYPNLPTAGYTYPTSGQVIYGKSIVGNAIGGVETYSQQAISTTLSAVAIFGLLVMVFAVAKGGR